MKRTQWITATAGLGLALMAPAMAQEPATTNATGNLPTQAPRANQTQGSGHNGIRTTRAANDVPGPIDSVRDIQDSLKMAFMAADQNHDGLLSQDEATDAGNLLVGGLFFSADADGDGKVTQQEAQAVRQKVMQQNPLLRFVIQRAAASKNRTNDASQTAAGIANLLDTNNDRAFSAAEIRQMVQSLVQATFTTADTDRDGQLSPTELNAAVYGAARASVQTAFQAADADQNNALSKDEFTKALANPTQAAFDVLDANLDGQLTLQEIDRATRVLAAQLKSMRIPQAENSATRLIEEGKTPGEVAPVPNIQVPPVTTNRAPNQ